MGLERSNAFIAYFTTGMEGDDWLQRPAGIPNPAIWILGHLAHSRAGFLEMLTGKRAYEKGWDELFAMGAQPRDPNEYPGVEACRAALDSRLADLKAFLETTTVKDLEGPPCKHPEHFKSKSAVFAFMTHHEAHHTGALSMIRRLLGKQRLV